MQWPKEKRMSGSGIRGEGVKGRPLPIAVMPARALAPKFESRSTQPGLRAGTGGPQA
jgi:hypothetical protein